MTEIWKPIPGAPFYEASSLGRIRSIDRTVPHGDGVGVRQLKGRVLRPKVRKVKPGTLAYHDVALCQGGKPRSETVHKLVALAFRGPKPSPLHEAAHTDGDPGNNQEGNVRWATNEENKADYKRHGRTARDISGRARDHAGRLM